jgi:hypothetical protein
MTDSHAYAGFHAQGAGPGMHASNLGTGLQAESRAEGGV